MNHVQPTNAFQDVGDVPIINKVETESEILLKRVVELSWKLLEQKITDDERKQLNLDLESSLAARQAYFDVMQIHLDITMKLGI